MRSAAIVFALLATALGQAHASPLVETRYCGEPLRNARGEIVRRADVLRAFKKVHACPLYAIAAAKGVEATHKPGTCPGWYMDHSIPLSCGGCDAVANLQWLPEAMWRAKSRFERVVYCRAPAR